MKLFDKNCIQYTLLNPCPETGSPKPEPQNPKPENLGPKPKPSGLPAATPPDLKTYLPLALDVP